MPPSRRPSAPAHEAGDGVARAGALGAVARHEEERLGRHLAHAARLLGSRRADDEAEARPAAGAGEPLREGLRAPRRRARRAGWPPTSSSWKSRPPGLLVRVSTKTPPRDASAARTNGSRASRPSHGFTVSASARSGAPSRGTRRRSASAVEPMSPRLASSTTGSAERARLAEQLREQLHASPAERLEEGALRLHRRHATGHPRQEGAAEVGHRLDRLGRVGRRRRTAPECRREPRQVGIDARTERVAELAHARDQTVCEAVPARRPAA